MSKEYFDCPERKKTSDPAKSARIKSGRPMKPVNWSGVGQSAACLKGNVTECIIALDEGANITLVP